MAGLLSGSRGLRRIGLLGVLRGRDVLSVASGSVQAGSPPDCPSRP